MNKLRAGVDSEGIHSGHRQGHSGSDAGRDPRRAIRPPISARPLLDGSFHETDSTEVAYKIAASMAFKDAARECGSPLILEPIMSCEIVCPEDYMGGVIGDLNSSPRQDPQHDHPAWTSGDQGRGRRFPRCSATPPPFALRRRDGRLSRWSSRSYEPVSAINRRRDQGQGRRDHPISSAVKADNVATNRETVFHQIRANSHCFCQLALCIALEILQSEPDDSGEIAWPITSRAEGTPRIVKQLRRCEKWQWNTRSALS